MQPANQINLARLAISALSSSKQTHRYSIIDVWLNATDQHCSNGQCSSQRIYLLI